MLEAKHASRSQGTEFRGTGAVLAVGYHRAPFLTRKSWEASPVNVSLWQERSSIMQQDLLAQRAQARRIEELLQTVAGFSDPQVRATTDELIQILLDMYGQGLARLLALIAQATTTGQSLIETLANDELVGALLLLHGLHPLPLEERVIGTLKEIQPYLQKHGAQAELLRVDEGIAYVRLASNGHGCSSTLSLVRTRVVETLHEAIPDLEDVRVENPSPAPRPQRVTFVPPLRSRQHTPTGSTADKPAVDDE